MFAFLQLTRDAIRALLERAQAAGDLTSDDVQQRLRAVAALAHEKTPDTQLLLNQRIEVVLGPVDLSIEGKNAQADFTVVLAGGNGRLYERGRIHKVSTHWREQDGQWLLYRAQWGDGQQQ